MSHDFFVWCRPEVKFLVLRTWMKEYRRLHELYIVTLESHSRALLSHLYMANFYIILFILIFFLQYFVVRTLQMRLFANS